MALNVATSGASYAQGNASPPVTALPLTLACWFKHAVGVEQVSLFSLIDSGDDYAPSFELALFEGDVYATSIQDDASAGNAIISGYSSGQWQHAAGVFASTTSRTPYLNGTAGTVSTTSRTFTGAQLDGFAVLNGYFTQNGEPTSNLAVAECAAWNVALTADEIAALAKGVSPQLIRPSALVAYYPLIRHTVSSGSTIPDKRGGQNLTVTGTGLSIVEHPRVIYPKRPKAWAGASGSPIYNESLGEAATAAEAQAATGVFAAARNDSATAADTQSATGAFGATDSESATASDAQSGAGAFPASADEAASADSTQSATGVFASSGAESATASDAPAATGVFGSAASESATAAETQSGALDMPASAAEAATADSTQAGSLGDNERSLDEAATADAAQEAELTAAPSLDEAATATDAPDGATVIGATLSEAASASDAPSAAQTISPTLSEAASADSAQSGEIGDPILAEQATADTSQSGAMVAAATMAETTLASDAQAATLISASSLAAAIKAHVEVQFPPRFECVAPLVLNKTGRDFEFSIDRSAIFSGVTVMQLRTALKHQGLFDDADNAIPVDPGGLIYEAWRYGARTSHGDSLSDAIEAAIGETATISAYGLAAAITL